MSRVPRLIPDHEWLARAARALRESELRLDGFTLARLRAARRRAVEAASGPRPALRWLLVPAALAVSVLAWFVMPRSTGVQDTQPVNVQTGDTLNVLTDELGPAFYQNLDLYRWLEEDEDRRA